MSCPYTILSNNKDQFSHRGNVLKFCFRNVITSESALILSVATFELTKAASKKVQARPLLLPFHAENCLKKRNCYTEAKQSLGPIAKKIYT